MVQGRDNFLQGVAVESSTVNTTDGSTVIKTAHYTVVVPAKAAAAAPPPPSATSTINGDGTTTTTFTLTTPGQAELIGCQIEGSNPTYLRSGDVKSDGSATMYLTLTPGTITGVAFAYQYVTGYKGTVGANFTLGVAGTAVYSSPMLNKYPYSKPAVYSPPVNVASSELNIAVPPYNGNVTFEFHNLDRNLQLELPIQINITCAGTRPCLAVPSPPPVGTLLRVGSTGGVFSSRGMMLPRLRLRVLSPVLFVRCRSLE